jgi:hypothetical protein
MDELAAAGESGGGVPRSPRDREGEEIGCIDNWLLASIQGWLYSSGRDKEQILGRIQKSFELEELRSAVLSLQGGRWTDHKVVLPSASTAGPAYSRKLAEEAYMGLLSIQNLDKPPVVFWVSAKDLHRVPGAAFRDDMSKEDVCGRLGLVDISLGHITEKLVATERMQETVDGLARSVSGLQAQLKGMQELQGAWPAVRAAGPAAEGPPARGAPSYRDTVRGRVDLVRAQARARSASSKRRRSASAEMVGEGQGGENKRLRTLAQQRALQEAQQARANHPAAAGSALSQDLRALREGDQAGDGYRQQGRRRKVIRKGASQVQAEGGEAAPVAVFLSGCNPKHSDADVMNKLRECAAAMPEGQELMDGLDFIRVDHIPLKIPPGETPRSKCWKVTVAPQFAAHMEKPAAYPAAWGWRKWRRGPPVLAARAGQGEGAGHVGA